MLHQSLARAVSWLEAYNPIRAIKDVVEPVLDRRSDNFDGPYSAQTVLVELLLQMS